MKKILIITSFLFLAINLNAQKADLIAGKWVFAKALNKDIDEAGLAHIKATVIGKWKLNFKSSGEFETSMMGEKMTGSWKYNSKSNAITLNGIEGGPQEFIILKSTKDELALQLGLGEFLLTKVKE